jgi:hypothetical protein
MTKTSILFLLLAFFSPALFAQWVDEGTLPAVPAANQPFRRSWTRPVYDTKNGTLDWSLASPACCSGTFNNAMFGYAAATATWSLYWSNGFSGTSSEPADAATEPVSRHPYQFVVWDSTRNGIWNGMGTGLTGGSTANCSDCGLTDLYFFDATAKTWTEVCGYDGVSSNNCPLLTPSIYSTSGTLGTGTQESAAAYDAVNDIILIYGGTIGGTAQANMWAFKPATGAPTYGSGTWSVKCTSCVPGALHRHTFLSIGGGKAILFGGGSGGCTTSPTFTCSGQTNNAWLYNVTSNTWTAISSTINPPADSEPVMDWVPSLNSIVLLDKEVPAHVLALNATTLQWTDLGIPSGPTLGNNNASGCPNDAICASGAYDPVANQFVLFIDGGSQITTHVWQLTLPGPFNGANVL